MPELPEVETIARDLSENIRHQKIISLDLLSSKSARNAASFFKNNLIGDCFKKISRRGKLLIFALQKTDKFLLIHLKMTGQLVYRGVESFGAGHPNDSLIGALPDKSTRVTIKFAQDGILFFNDQRKFGSRMHSYYGAIGHG